MCVYLTTCVCFHHLHCKIVLWQADIVKADIVKLAFF